MIRSLFTFSLFTLLSVVVRAEIEVRPFLDSQLVKESADSDIDSYRWVTGAVNKISGSYGAETEQRLVGELQRKVWEIGREFEVDEVHEHLLDQLLPGSSIRFECQGIDCGISNIWANQIFKVSQLYGLETEQRYSTGVSLVDQTQQVWVLYTVKRGNKRVYQILDQLTLSEPLANATSDGRPRWYFNEENRFDWRSRLEQVQQILERETSLQVYLVGHYHDEQRSEQQNQQQSEQQAQQIADQLILLGVSAQRIEIRAVGDLAPTWQGDIPSTRVDLFFRSVR